jgi:hypothetical protein
MTRALLAALLLLAACARGAWVRTELYFGSARPAGASPVSEGEWLRFLSEEVAPRFPNGFTVIPASGHWERSEESSHVVIIVRPDDGDAERRLEELRAVYAKQFAQQSVLRVDQRASVSF